MLCNTVTWGYLLCDYDRLLLDDLTHAVMLNDPSATATRHDFELSPHPLHTENDPYCSLRKNGAAQEPRDSETNSADNDPLSQAIAGGEDRRTTRVPGWAHYNIIFLLIDMINCDAGRCRSWLST